MNYNAYRMPADALSIIEKCDIRVISGAHNVWEKAQADADTAFLRQFATQTDYAAWCAENYLKARGTN
ncbi:MAG TPA: hypothetical protein P5102_15215 [Candidatus Competibacteraceae bacterium]|nr:hypothetical protein [Candidatus Competibacteraceae bacterium]HSA47755.1 hypothetical protein [Candidatus Competibacteraceae bacterium]